MQQSLLNELTTSITPELVGHAAHLLHESPANTGKAIAAALPTLLSGASMLTGTQSGLTALANLASNSANDGKLLHQLPALYQGRLDGTPMAVLGKQLLAASFGSRAQDAAKELASESGLKPASSERLLGILSPHVLSVIGHHQRAEGAKGVGEAVDLVEREFIFRPRTENDAAAGGTEIDCGGVDDFSERHGGKGAERRRGGRRNGVGHRGLRGHGGRGRVFSCPMKYLKQLR